MLYSTEKKICKFVSLCLAMLIMFTIFPEIHINSLAATEDDFSLSLKWRNTNTADCALDIKYSGTTLVTLATVYESTNKDHPAYAAGELTIVVPGIGNVYRGSSIAEPYDIAADLASETDKKYDWSYTYDSENDVYTFTNNNEIPEGGNFVGSFEMVYELSNRNCENGYSQELKASLSVANDDTVCESEAANFSVTTKKDEYDLKINPQRLFNPNRFDFEESVSDYIWVDYAIYGNFYDYARAVEGSEYFEFTISSDIEVVDITNSAKTSLSDSLQTTQNDDGTTTYRYAYNVSSDGTLSSPWNHIYLAFPKSKYANTEFDLGLQMTGKYYEEETEEVLSEETSNIDLSIYAEPFGYFSLEHYISGSVNSADTTCGLSHYYTAHDRYIDGIKISKGATITDSIEAYNSTFEEENSHYYDTMEITFEKLNVYLNDGTAETVMPAYDETKERTLAENEYKYTELYIPKLTKTSDGFPYNGSGVKVDIYVKTTDKEEEYLFKTITPNYTNVTLPDNTYNIRLVYYNMSDYLYISPYVTAQLFIDNTAGNIESDYGYVRSVVNFSLYDQQQHTETVYGGLIDAKRTDFQHIHKRLTIFDTYTILESFTFAGSDLSDSDSGFTSELELSTKFTYAEGDDVKSCSMYTILPKQLELPNGVETAEDLYSYLTFSASGYSSEFLKEHCNIIIDKNYRDSGRTYLGFEFDFWEQPINQSISVYVYVDIFLPQFNYLIIPNASSVYVTSVGMATDINNIELSAGYERADNGSYSSPASLWFDIDNDNKTDDLVDYASDSENIIHANHTQENSIKYVSTSRVTSFTNTAEPVLADLASNYEYRLAVSTSETDATNVVFFDDLENNSSSEWQGTLVEVDTSFAESKGFEPIVYYSIYEDAPREDLTDEKWTITPPDDMASVKRIAVDLNDELPSNSLMYIVLKMKAPGDDTWTYEQLQEYVGKVAKSTYTMKLTKLSSGDVYIDSNELTVELAEPASNITVIKQDKDNNDILLSGAKFELYSKTDDTLVDTVITGNNGKAIFYNVPYGEYYLKETVSPLGYGASAESQDISVKLQGNIEIAVDNTKLEIADLAILKVDKADQKPLEGAVFSLYRVNIDESGSLIKRNITTDAEGKASATDLPYGTYYLEETTAPTDYDICEKFYFTIDSEAGASVTVENQKTPGTVILNKRGEKTGRKIVGAVFNLYEEETDELVMENLVTDSNGQIVLTRALEWGNYYFKEMENPTGYIMDEASEYVPFEIKAGQTTVTLTVTNEEIPVKIYIHIRERNENGSIVDEYDPYQNFEEPNPDGSYDGHFFSNIDVYFNSEYYTTDEYGAIEIDNVLYGDYKSVLPELDGYQTPTVTTISVTERGTRTFVLEYRRDRKFVEFVVRDDFGQPVPAGMRFDLYYKSTSDPEQTYTRKYSNLGTNDYGEITNNLRLSWGCYYLVPVGTSTSTDGTPNSLKYDFSSEPTYFVVNSIPGKSTIPVKNAEGNSSNYGGLNLTSFPLLIECTVNRQKGTVSFFAESYETDSEGANYSIFDGKYSLYKTDGTLGEEGTLIAENLTVNNSGYFDVDGLDCGTYYFVETQTPKNHLPYTDKIPFVVNINNLNPTVESYNEADYKITLTKRINLSDIVLAHGNPTFVFRVAKDSGEVYSKSFEFTESYINQYKEQHPGLDYVEMSATFSGLTKGTYTVSEEAPIRYALEKIEGLTENGTQSEQTVSFDLNVYENEGSAVFVGKKVVQSGTSASSQSTSSFKAQKIETPSVVGVTYEIAKGKIPAVQDTTSVNDGWRTINNLSYYTFTIHYKYDDGTEHSITFPGKNATLSDGGNISEDTASALSVNFSSDYLVTLNDPITGKEIHTFVKSVNYQRESTILKQTQDGEVKITGYRGNLKGVTKIPSKYFTCFMNPETQKLETKEWNVTKVGDTACRYWNSHKYEIIFAEGITEICDGARIAEALKITLPKSVEKIGDRAFVHQSLNSIARLRILEIIGADDGTSKLTSIGINAFTNNQFLKEINIPKTVTSIAAYAFVRVGYRYTENINIIPSPGFRVNFLDFEDTTYKLTIGNFVFQQCVKLKEIEIPERVSSIGILAFVGCTELEKITIFKESSSISGEPWGVSSADVIWNPLP